MLRNNIQKKQLLTIFICVLLLFTACNQQTNEKEDTEQNIIFRAPQFSEEEKVEIKKSEAEEVINTYFNEIRNDGDACYPEKMVESMSPIYEGEKFYKYTASNNYEDWFSVEMVMITAVSNNKEEISLAYIHLLPEKSNLVTIQPYLCKSTNDEEMLMTVNRYILKIKADDKSIDYKDLERKGFQFNKEENNWEKTEQLLFIKEK